MTRQLYFNFDPDSADAFGDISDVLKDTIKRFDSLNKTVLKAERQLMKFDEINRLVAYEVKEKNEAAGKSSSGSSSKKSSSSGSSKGKDGGPSAHSRSSKSREATLPMYFTIKDVLFNWDDLDPEQIMMKIIAGLTALGGGAIGFLAGGMFGGVPGAIIGLGAGLLFGILLDNTVFNFDGELSKEEFWNSLTIALGTIGGGLIGFMAAGPFGVMLGLTIGLVFSMVLTGINWDTVLQDMDEFFADLNENFHYRWESFQRLMSEKFAGLRNWWNGLNLGRFQFRVPHLTVEWQELASDSVLAKFLGITAIPHLSVQWYARGGIVDGPTLIGAGEAGKEAIIPLERNTFWIHEVAVQLKEEFEKLAPSNALTLVSLPAAASGALVPPSAAAPSAPLDLGSLADTIASAIASAGQSSQSDPVIRVYLDGKQLTDVVTKYQRRNERAFG
ncbi:MAG: glycine zipper family protein [Oscillospiraceae bacterium]|nr:glycine zipper family protein [Oscillospiraceae bacterium]